MNKTKPTMLLKLTSFILFFIFYIGSQNVNAQIKLFNNGDIAIGSITTPRQNIELRGKTLFTNSSSAITSAPMIIGKNGFTNKENPSYTFFGDNKTGIFHHAWNSLGFSVGAKSRLLLNNLGSIFTDSINYLYSAGSAATIRSLHNYSTASNPDYTWFNNDNTGMYHPSHNNICFSIDGVSAMCMEWSWNTGLGVNWHQTSNTGTLRLLRGDRTPSGTTQYLDLLYDPNLGGVINSGSDEIYFFNYETGGYNTLYTNEVYQLSDLRKKKNIINLDSVSRSKLLLLNAKKFNYIDSKNTVPDKYGFIAQEVELVFPELVVTNGNGDKMINYIEFIPLLIDELNAQNNKIIALENKLNNCCSSNLNEKNKSLDNSNMSWGEKSNAVIKNETIEKNNFNNKLFQNKPNPFNQQTVIEWYIAEPINTAAYIYVFDLNGKMLYQHPILSTGEGKFSFQQGSLSTGMYLYSLYVNEKEVDTKRMIINQR